MSRVENFQELIPEEEGEKFGFFENTESNNKKQAKENSKNYIKCKYGFEPKIISVDLDINDGGIPVRTGYAFVKAQYNDKEFMIIIPCNKKSINGADNYQADEIEKAIIEVMEDEIGKPYSYKIRYYSNIAKNLGNQREYDIEVKCIQEYYDKGKIEDLLTNNNFYICLSYIDDVDFKKIETTDNKFITSNKVELVAGKLKSKEKDIYNFTSSNKVNLMYSAICLEKGFSKTISSKGENEFKYYNFDMIEIDGIYIYAENMKEVNIKKTNNNDPEWAINNGNQHRITNDYIIKGIEGELYVYYPAGEEKKAYLYYLNENGYYERDYSTSKSGYFTFNIKLKGKSTRISIFGIGVDK